MRGKPRGRPTAEEEAAARDALGAAGWTVRPGVNPAVLVAQQGPNRVFGRDACELRRHLRLTRPDVPVDEKAA
jgi:hypothetical protein